MENTLMANPMFFAFFAGIALFCSLMVVFMKNPVSSALSLVLVFVSQGALYALMGAHLIAAMQILVYTGAVMVLFIFVIMLLNADVPSLDLVKTSVPFKAVSAGALVAVLALLVMTFKKTTVLSLAGKWTPDTIQAHGGNTRVVSEILFNQYILPFEVTGILLLGGIVGVVAIAMRKAER